MKLQIPRQEYLRVKVIPKSAKTEISEIMEDSTGEKTVKIRLKSAPEKGRANTELLKFLRKELSLPIENISILSGKTEQLKLLKIKWTS